MPTNFGAKNQDQGTIEFHETQNTEVDGFFGDCRRTNEAHVYLLTYLTLSGRSGSSGQSAWALCLQGGLHDQGLYFFLKKYKNERLLCCFNILEICNSN